MDKAAAAASEPAATQQQRGVIVTQVTSSRHIFNNYTPLNHNRLAVNDIMHIMNGL